MLQGTAVAYQNFPIDYQEPSTSTLIPFFSWSLDTATWFAVHSSEAAIRDWLGFFCSHTDAWRGGPSAGLLVETGPEGLRVRAPLEDFERHWGIVAARGEDALVDKDEETNKCFQAQARLAQTPLDRVRKMALEWERPAESYRPHLLLKSGDLSAVRQRARSEQEFRRLFEAGRQPPEQETDPAGVYLATGDEAYAKAAKEKCAFLPEAMDSAFPHARLRLVSMLYHHVYPSVPARGGGLGSDCRLAGGQRRGAALG